MGDDPITSRGLRDQKENKWVDVQQKAFKVWINTYLDPLGYKIEEVGEDFKDGVNLCIFLEQVRKKQLKGWSKKPAMRVHKIENMNIALQCIQKEIGIRLLGIGAEDIADGNMKLTLGMLWSLFKRLRIEVISQDGQSSEMGLLAWLKKMTEDYEGVDIKNFKESFNDGLAFCALINAMDPEALDFYSLDPAAKEQNINAAFDAAEAKLGVPKLLEVEDLLDGNVDERAVILYSSMFFHAYHADEEKRKLVEQKKGIHQQINELKEELAREQMEKAALQKLQDDKDALIAKLRARIKELITEIEFLRNCGLSNAEVRAALEAKIATLNALMKTSEAIESSMVSLSKEEILEWVQQMTGSYENVTVENFDESFKDGMVLSALVHSMDKSALDFASLDAANAEENVANAIKIAETKLGIPASISADNVVAGTASEDSMTAYTGTFMKKYIAEHGSSTVPPAKAKNASFTSAWLGETFNKEDLLSWAQTTTSDYENVSVENFGSSFANGLAFSALIHKLEPTAIDFDSLDAQNAEENLENAFKVASEKLGIASTLNVSEILNNTASEDEVAAYTSQFYKKFVAESDLFADSKNKTLPSPLGLSGISFSPEDLLSWVQKATKDYDNVEVTDFASSFNNGLALAALVHVADPTAIDFASLNPENAEENVRAALAAAQSELGIESTLNVEDLVAGKASEEDIIAYNAQFFQKYLNSSSLFPGANQSFTPEQLLGWIQKETKDYDNVEVSDFNSSFNNGLALAALVHAADPTAIDFASLNPENAEENVRAALDAAESKLGIAKTLNAEDLVAGKASEEDIIAYNSQFYKKHLDAAASRRSFTPEQLLGWIQKETKDYDNVEVSDFESSFNNGLALAALVHAADPTAIDFASLNPENAEENVRAALDAAESKLGIAKTLNAADLVAGKATKEEIIAYNSQFYEKHLDAAASKSFTPEQLLGWIQKETKDYDNVEVSDFNSSFNNGLALAALVHAADPTAIDFASLNPENAEENVRAALDAAESKLGIAKTLNAEDLVAGKASEEDIIAYNSQFYKKYLDLHHVDTGRGITSDVEKQRQLDEMKAKRNALLGEISSLQKGLKDEIAMRKKMAEEILFLRDQACSDASLRSILQDKVNVLENLVDGSNSTISELSEKQHRLTNELDSQRKRGEELGSGLSELESERNLLISDTESKGRRLRDLEEKRNRLANELSELQKRVREEMARRQEQAKEIASLKHTVEHMGQKQIVQSKARVGLDALKKNLEDHLEDLYKWRDLNEIELEEDLEEFDLEGVVSNLEGKNFEDQLELLDAQLQQENRTLTRVIKLADDKNYLDDVVLKSGWLVMKGHKDWKKRWFCLAGNRFSFYEDEESEDVAGSINLGEGCDVIRHKATKEENSNKKVWPLKVTVGDRKLFIRASSKKERHSWFAALSSKIAHLNYITHCDEVKERPDSRLVGVLNAASSPFLDVSGKPLSGGKMKAIAKGIAGRDEMENISFSNTGMTSKHFNDIASVLEKLSIKELNFSKNKLDGTIGDKFSAIAKPELVTSLNFSGNQLDDAFLASASAAIGTCTSLNVCNLSDNNITAAGVPSLVEALSAEGVVLEDLVLSKNDIGDEGASALAGLCGKKSFRRILLSNCNIGDVGAEALAAVLKNAAVEEIDLSNNKISAKGAIALKQLMESNDRIISLDLASNPIVPDADTGALLNSSSLALASLTFGRR